MCLDNFFGIRILLCPSSVSISNMTVCPFRDLSDDFFLLLVNFLMVARRLIAIMTGSSTYCSISYHKSAFCHFKSRMKWQRSEFYRIDPSRFGFNEFNRGIFLFCQLCPCLCFILTASILPWKKITYIYFMQIIIAFSQNTSQIYKCNIFRLFFAHLSCFSFIDFINSFSLISLTEVILYIYHNSFPRPGDIHGQSVLHMQESFIFLFYRLN